MSGVCRFLICILYTFSVLQHAFVFILLDYYSSNRVAIAFIYYYMSIERIEKKEVEQMSRHLGVDLCTAVQFRHFVENPKVVCCSTLFSPMDGSRLNWYVTYFFSNCLFYHVYLQLIMIIPIYSISIHWVILSKFFNRIFTLKLFQYFCACIAYSVLWNRCCMFDFRNLISKIVLKYL